MAETFNLQHVHLAARWYYIDNRPQAEIARSLNVSQAKISRLLSEARARGIVRISVADIDFRDTELESELSKQLRLESPIVVRTPHNATGQDLRTIVSHYAASLVDAAILPKKTLAVSGGRTLGEIAQQLPRSHKADVTVVPAMGSVAAQVDAFDALEVARGIAAHCGASLIAFSAPAFLPDKKTRDTFIALEQIRSVKTRLSQADVALVGIGTLSNSVFVENGFLPRDDVQRLEAAGAIGEICGRFFNADGDECETPWRERVVSIEFSQLRRIPNVTAIVTGLDRVAAIAAAIRGRLIKSLIIDETTAKALLSQQQSVRKTKKSKIEK